MIGTGAMCDPYMHCEEELQYTRKCLEVIYAHNFGVSILTKSDRILRDIDIIEKINNESKAVVQMTMTTYDEDLCRIIEPNVCITIKRYEVLKECQKRNIPTVVWLCPILPYINDTEENINGILNYCFDAGVAGIINFGFGLTLRNGNREYFYSKLDEYFPGLKEKYMHRYGNSYECMSDNAGRLNKIFYSECSAHKCMSSNDDIFAFLNEYPRLNEQLTIFD